MAAVSTKVADLASVTDKLVDKMNKVVSNSPLIVSHHDCSPSAAKCSGRHLHGEYTIPVHVNPCSGVASLPSEQMDPVRHAPGHGLACNEDEPMVPCGKSHHGPEVKLRFVDDSACGRTEHLSPASCPGSFSYRYQQPQQPSSLHGTGDSGPESYEEETETTETRVIKKKRSRR